MTPEQRLHFCQLLKEASLNKSNITINDVISKVGISKEEARQSWYVDFCCVFALEHDYKWILYARENTKD